MDKQFKYKHKAETRQKTKPRQNYGRHYLATLRDRRWRHKVLHPYYEEMESHHPEIQIKIKIKNETISFQTFFRFVFITYNL